MLTEGVPEKADELNVRDVPTVMEPVLVTDKGELAEQRAQKKKGQCELQGRVLLR